MKRSIILAIIILFFAVSSGHASALVQLPKRGQATRCDPFGTEITCAGLGQGSGIPRFTVSKNCVRGELTSLMSVPNTYLSGETIWA
jgi:hypothetical protein